ncbi:MAG: CHAT domain-containing protein [Spirulina sp.]
MPKILFLAANPKNTTRLRLDEELRDIKEGLRRAQQRDQFTLISHEAARSRDIQRAMLDEMPQIVHFSGHGDGESGLAFEDEIGQAKLIDGKALADLFALFADPTEFPEPLTCVVLNGCYSQVQANAIADYVPYVIGMTQAVKDKAAIEFAVGFYDALGAGRSVPFAFKLACNAIARSGQPAAEIPTLLNKIQPPTPASPPTSTSPLPVGEGPGVRAEGSGVRAIPQNRTQLYQFLLSLPGPQFEMVVFDLNPPKGNISPSSAPQGQRVPELLDWLESPIGPGLAALRTSLGNVLYPQAQPGQTGAGSRNVSIGNSADGSAVVSGDGNQINQSYTINIHRDGGDGRG